MNPNSSEGICQRLRIYLSRRRWRESNITNNIGVKILPQTIETNWKFGTLQIYAERSVLGSIFVVAVFCPKIETKRKMHVADIARST